MQIWFAAINIEIKSGKQYTCTRKTNNKIREVILRQTRSILLLIALFYFVHSQVAPYLHFHYHDHQSNPGYILNTPDHTCHNNNKLCCKEHHHNHKLIEVDWNYISNAKNIKVKISVDVIALLPKVECNANENFTSFIVSSTPIILDRIFPKHFNKAPPVYA